MAGHVLADERVAADVRQLDAVQARKFERLWSQNTILYAGCECTSMHTWCLTCAPPAVQDLNTCNSATSVQHCYPHCMHAHTRLKGHRRTEGSWSGGAC